MRILYICTLLKVVRHYDLSSLSMSVMSLKKSLDMGWLGRVKLYPFFVGIFSNFTKPLSNIYPGNSTESEVDMKKAKKMTVIYYRIKATPKRNKSRILKSASLKIKLYLNKHSHIEVIWRCFPSLEAQMPEHNLEPPRFSRRALERVLNDWPAVKAMLNSGVKEKTTA